jgi:hypothetical protein
MEFTADSRRYESAVCEDMQASVFGSTVIVKCGAANAVIAL